VTATQIIDEIKRLDPKEQAGVVRFVYQLDAERKLSGPELSTLAERLVNAKDPTEASVIREFFSQMGDRLGSRLQNNLSDNGLQSRVKDLCLQLQGKKDELAEKESTIKALIEELGLAEKEAEKARWDANQFSANSAAVKVYVTMDGNAVPPETGGSSPNGIIYDQRFQQLSMGTAAALATCAANNMCDVDLVESTLAAHSFDFVAPNVEKMTAVDLLGTDERLAQVIVVHGIRSARP